jgi:hypothetical protein
VNKNENPDHDDLGFSVGVNLHQVDPTGIESALSVLISMLATWLICPNFRQMAMHNENSPKINARPDGQAK